MPSAAPPADVRLVRTDIAGFVGFAERGGPATAVKLTSWKDFRLRFGGFLPDAYLAYAVRGFFANGGTTCYVVRVASTTSPPLEASLPLPAAEAPRRITSLAQAIKRQDQDLKLEYTGALSVGDLISAGPPEDAECFSVSTVVDEQTITVKPRPEAERAAGQPVYKIQGSALSRGVQAGQTDIPVGDASTFKAGDLVSLEGRGIAETRLIVELPGGAILRLARGVEFSYSAGVPVRRYPAAMIVRASSAGAWGNRIKLDLIPLQAGPAVKEFSMRVTADASGDLSQPVEQEFYPRLSLDPTSANAAVPFFAPDVVKNASQLVRLELVDTPGAPAPDVALLFGSGPLQRSDTYLQGGSDGEARAEVTTDDFRNALKALELVDEVAILAAPDAQAVIMPSPPPPPPPPPGPCDDGAVTAIRATRPQAVQAKWSAQDIQAAMLDQCARLRYRVALLDPPMSQQPEELLAWLDKQRFDARDAKFAALYYPWLRVPDERTLDGSNQTVPPCGHVAGAYAYTDSLFGVQKPPANVELDFIADLERDVSDQQQGRLNERGINVIRPFAGRGIRVWGARSISADADWRYIHTRRLLSMIEDSVEKASQWTVFEPNDDDLRRSLTHSLNVFLETIWRSGGLKGARPEQGFFVKCDTTNNPQSAIDTGLLVCQVGVAIAAPMEFIIFEMRRSVEGQQVVEA